MNEDLDYYESLGLDMSVSRSHRAACAKACREDEALEREEADVKLDYVKLVAKFGREAVDACRTGDAA